MTKVTITSELGGHKAGDTLDVTPGVAAQLIASEHAEIVGEQPGSGAEPPRSGKGSGIDKWKQYAESKGHSVPDDADRDTIIALVDADSVNED